MNIGTSLNKLGSIKPYIPTTLWASSSMNVTIGRLHKISVNWTTNNQCSFDVNVM